MSDDNELKEFEVQEEVAHVEIPAKFQDKSLEDVVKSYTELEKLHGRQSREMGELRKLADDLVMRSLNQPTPKVEEEKVDFYTEPDKYVAQAINNNPRLAEIERTAQVVKKAEVLNELKDRYGDVQEIVADPEFQEWIAKSKVRQELFVRADKAFDLDAGNELLSIWKDLKRVEKTNQVKEEQEEDLNRNLQAVGSVKGNSGISEGKGKIYRRADIIRLQVTDPKRYTALAPEIRKAYSEGRVR